MSVVVRLRICQNMPISVILRKMGCASIGDNATELKLFSTSQIDWFYFSFVLHSHVIRRIYIIDRFKSAHPYAATLYHVKISGMPPPHILHMQSGQSSHSCTFHFVPNTFIIL